MNLLDIIKDTRSYLAIAKSELTRLQHEHIRNNYTITLTIYGGGITYHATVKERGTNINLFQKYGVNLISNDYFYCENDFICSFLEFLSNNAVDVTP
jgi:hypothetical protein